jgi:hypothetical protein
MQFKTKIQEGLLALKSSNRGSELLSVAEQSSQTVIIRESSGGDAPYHGDGIFMDTLDPAGVGPETILAYGEFLRRYPLAVNQLPPPNEKGCAVTLAHELGHAIYDENNEYIVLKRDENPVRNDLGLARRLYYGAHPLPAFPTESTLRKRVGLP